MSSDPWLADAIASTSSSLIRFACYVFLRWIPTSLVAPALGVLIPIYILSFSWSYFSKAPGREVIDFVDRKGEEKAIEIIERSNGMERSNGFAGPTRGAVTEIMVKEKQPQILRTLLYGRPSPTSQFWSYATFSINFFLVWAAVDLIYRAPLLHRGHDLSFARVGYVSDSSARLLVREPEIAQLPVKIWYRYADAPKAIVFPYAPIDSRWHHVAPIYGLANDTDFTASVTLSPLRPDSRYQYAVSNGARGFFNTAPEVGTYSKKRTAAPNTFTFLHSSCILPNFPYNPLNHPLHVPGFAHLASWLPSLKASFMLFLGDFIYVDVPVRFSASVAEYRQQYRQIYASPDWPSVSNDTGTGISLPWLHVYDDHEIANDWDRNTTGLYSAAYDAYKIYHVAINPPSQDVNQTYFQFTQGPASFFMLDTRRYRDQAHSASSEDPKKSMLGETQLRAVLAWVHNPLPAGVRWKILVSSVPFTQNWRFGTHDTWGGYLGERQVLLDAMWAFSSRGGASVVVLSGDRHEFAATQFPPPRGSKYPASAAVTEFSVSPLSMFYLPTRTFREVDPSTDAVLKYLPDGNSKFSAVEMSEEPGSGVGVLKYRLFVDGKEKWTHVLTTPEEKTILDVDVSIGDDEEVGSESATENGKQDILGTGAGGLLGLGLDEGPGRENDGTGTTAGGKKSES